MLATTTPESAGFTPDLSASLDLAREAGLLPNVHGIVAMRHGRIFLERYYPGADAARARPLGIIRFTPDTLHDLRSVSKSIVGLLYGIALAAGLVPPPEAPLLAQFPEHADLAADPARAALTIAHTLSMTLGTEWDEMSLPYSDPRNSEIAMDNAPDGIRFILERKIVGPAGQRWTYNGGATALLAHLIARGSGQSLHDFARARLFTPLGISATEWETGADGMDIAASGLRMRPRDLALIGVMLLNGGSHNGQQIVPKAWLDLSATPAVAMPDGRRYGYHWYLGATPRDDGNGGIRWERLVQATGYGGQRLFLLPELHLVLVVTAGNYDSAEQWRPPLAVLRDVLLAGLREQAPLP